MKSLDIKVWNWWKNLTDAECNAFITMLHVMSAADYREHGVSLEGGHYVYKKKEE